MTHLPLLPPSVVKGSLRADGSRDIVQPADVRGRFLRARRAVYASLLLVFAALPWARIHGRPALLLDVARRQFFVLGATFNAQDAWLLFFVLSGIGFALIYVTAWIGRVFCGWVCPQTALLDLVYRRIERWVEGPREVRIRRRSRPWNWDRTWRAAVTHSGYVAVSILLALGTVAFFVPVRGGAGELPRLPSVGTAAWACALAAIYYFDFAFFREQLCLAICPYGRLQSAMIDANTVTVGYDAARGEPRAKAKAHGPLPDDGTMSKGAGPENAGDCVDCKRCVVVCPTGIDIRNGLQIDCVACTACIDACDEIMDRLHRPRGLVRYASAAALAGDKTRWIRSRTVVYTALLGAGAVAAVIAFGKHEDFEANLLRLPGPPYTLDGDSVRDGFEVHLVNKTGQQKTYTIAGETDVPEASLVVALPRVEVAAMQGTRVPILISLPRSAFLHDFGVRVRVRPVDEEAHERVLSGQFLGARSGG